jgi:small subunit ribosomal protein S35
MGRGSVKREEEFITPWQSFEEKRINDVDDKFEASIANLSEEEQIKIDEEGDKWLESLERNKFIRETEEEVGEQFKFMDRVLSNKRIRQDFWNDEELEEEEITDGMDEDVGENNEITSMAHHELEEHRERRQYARYAVWEMPLLARELSLHR